jgi:hypothetical protein
MVGLVRRIKLQIDISQQRRQEKPTSVVAANE